METKICEICGMELRAEDFSKYGDVCFICSTGKSTKGSINAQLSHYRNPDKKLKLPYTEERQNYYKEYNLRMKEKTRDYRNKYQSRRIKYLYANDTLFRFSSNLRSRMGKIMRKLRVGKPTRTETLLGAEFKTVRDYIEKQFRKGMTWDNYGEWQVDHIIPLASAKSEEELFTLFHYKNLQPLWASENSKKSDKVLDPKPIQLRMVI